LCVAAATGSESLRALDLSTVIAGLDPAIREAVRQRQTYL